MTKCQGPMLKTFIFAALLAASGVLFANPAPDFTITDTDGKVRTLYSDFVLKGKVAVIEVFFTTCPPCASHAPHWQGLYEDMTSEYPGQVEFFMLSDKAGDSNAAVAQYKTDKGLTMIAAGADGGSVDAVQPYKSGQFGPFYGTPTFLIVSPNTGEVLYDIRGSGAAGTMDSIRQKIAELLMPVTCVVETAQGDTLQNYTLQTQVPGNGAMVNIPVTTGMFSMEQISGLPVVPEYELTPHKNDDQLNGVSTFDLLQINKQILGITPFQESWQFVAADANNSNSITTFDIVELRKLILGVYDSLPFSTSWVFMPGMDTISAQTCPEFSAIKRGDVNGNANPTALQDLTHRGPVTLTISTPDIELLPGQVLPGYCFTG